MNTPDDIRAKWDTRYSDNPDKEALAAQVLTENLHLLPDGGDALDLACGLGGSARMLATRGFRVQAWDISTVAIERLRADAQAENLAIECAVRDTEAEPPEPDSFDVIVVRFFLSRALAPAIASALRPGGLLFYETFSCTRLKDIGPTNPEYRLKQGELLQLFPSLIPRVYREEGLAGDTDQGLRDVAQLVAERPAD